MILTALTFDIYFIIFYYDGHYGHYHAISLISSDAIDYAITLRHAIIDAGAGACIIDYADYYA